MFSAVAVGLQLEHRLEASERFLFPIARPLPLCSWFSRFLQGSGNLQFKTHKWCCDWSREITAEVEALAASPRSPLPGVLSGDWEQLSAALFSGFVACYLEGFPSQRESLFWGPQKYHLSHSIPPHTHRHSPPPRRQWLVDMATEGWPLCSQSYSMCHNSSTRGSLKPHSGWAHSTA